jgi:hypothetical protein
MPWLNTRYKQLGLGLVLLYALLQAAVIYGYYFPPVNAREWTTTLATILPWIGGVELIGTLNFIGERLSFTMATTYLPGLFLGLLVTLREVAFNSVHKSLRPKWIDIMTCLFFLTVLCLVHYIGYWQKYAWGRTPQLIHTFIAIYIPFISGFLFTGVFLLVKRLISTERKNFK